MNIRMTCKSAYEPIWMQIVLLRGKIEMPEIYNVLGGELFKFKVNDKGYVYGTNHNGMIFMLNTDTFTVLDKLPKLSPGEIIRIEPPMSRYSSKYAISMRPVNVISKWRPVQHHMLVEDVYLEDIGYNKMSTTPAQLAVFMCKPDWRFIMSTYAKNNGTSFDGCNSRSELRLMMTINVPNSEMKALLECELGLKITVNRYQNVHSHTLDCHVAIYCMGYVGGVGANCVTVSAENYILVSPEKLHNMVIAPLLSTHIGSSEALVWPSRYVLCRDDDEPFGGDKLSMVLGNSVVRDFVREYKR